MNDNSTRRHATDAEVAAWAERYDLAAILGNQARSAFEDAESLHMTYAAPLAQQVAKPSTDAEKMLAMRAEYDRQDGARSGNLVQQVASPTAKPTSGAGRYCDDSLRDTIGEGLRGLYVCGRTWSAWQAGTMTEDDFYPAEDSDECVDEIFNRVCAIINGISIAAPVASVPDVVGETFAAWIAREMPAGTVIGDPAWWAPRILQAVQPAAPADLDDLAALTRQLVYALKKAKPDSDLAARAVNYLQRKGLAGSPLRAAPPERTAAPDARAKEWYAAADYLDSQKTLEESELKTVKLCATVLRKVADHQLFDLATQQTSAQEGTKP
jgi:hypothetical protein